MKKFPIQRSRPKGVFNLLCAVAGIAGVSILHAADQTWSNTGTDYNMAANWTGGLPGTGDAALFSSAVTNQPILSAPITNQQIRFITLTGGWTLSGSSALTLTSTGTGATAGTGSAIVSANTSGTSTFCAPIILVGALATTPTFTQTAGGTLAITGNISSTNAITGLSLAATGATGTFILSGSNTYNGTTTLGSNTALNINSATAISAGTLVFAGSSTLDNTSGSAITLSNNNNINLSGGTLTFTGTRDLSFGSGTVTASVANRTITTTAGTLTIGNIDTDTTARTFSKAGPGGTLVIQNAAGANFQGGFILASGTVQIGNNSASGTDCLHLAYGVDYHGGVVNPPGYEAVFKRDADGAGYTIEARVPWELLHAQDDPPRPGDVLGVCWSTHWSDPSGRLWRTNLIELRSPSEPLRIYDFERAATWGRAIYRRFSIPPQYHHQG